MSEHERLPESTNAVSKVVVECAYQVHEHLGPGLLESIYELCLAEELAARGHRVVRQRKIPVRYKGKVLDADLRLDLLVEDCVVIEVKTVDLLLPLHEAQLLTYLKLSGVRLGLLINFNVPRIKDGLRRRIL